MLQTLYKNDVLWNVCLFSLRCSHLACLFHSLHSVVVTVVVGHEHFDGRTSFTRCTLSRKKSRLCTAYPGVCQCTSLSEWWHCTLYAAANQRHSVGLTDRIPGGWCRDCLSGETSAVRAPTQSSSCSNEYIFLFST